MHLGQVFYFFICPSSLTSLCIRMQPAFGVKRNYQPAMPFYLFKNSLLYSYQLRRQTVPPVRITYIPTLFYIIYKAGHTRCGSPERFTCADRTVYTSFIFFCATVQFLSHTRSGLPAQVNLSGKPHRVRPAKEPSWSGDTRRFYSLGFCPFCMQKPFYSNCFG